MKYIFYPLLLMSFVTTISPKKFGNTPQGARKERVLRSPNYRDGRFQNLNHTPQLTSKSKGAMLFDALLGKHGKHERVRPDSAIAALKTDLHGLNPDEDLLVWFGHSSYYMQVEGKRLLVDPVFSRAASPVFFFNRTFKGANIYAAADMPDIDYLIITHDHWDHLDYPTVKALRRRVAKVICPLGVGEHFERWDFDMQRVVELDWNETAHPDTGVEFVCLPARHFSGRGFSPRQSLWASFLLKTPTLKVYMGGDGGYDTHFADIGRRFGPVDFALLENGQYNDSWRYIHMKPEEMLQAGKDLRAKVVMPVHNSKFALSLHPWDEPMNRAVEAWDSSAFGLAMPMIGERVLLRDTAPAHGKWWQR
ncbi:MAG: MBL fold metallo-hydrolase [Prevotellaceae bacterium]|jgi:L-ascorbate metabolism protein UlaG (beta-lactamase superfamily)|nr:MBL fold metallo-hydrolase [Prevotellaceae bacterium]